MVIIIPSRHSEYEGCHQFLYSFELDNLPDCHICNGMESDYVFFHYLMFKNGLNGEGTLDEMRESSAENPGGRLRYD